MSEYGRIIEDAIQNGFGEEALHRSVKVIDSMLLTMQDDDPDLYDKYIREISEAMYGSHYNETMAIKDVCDLHYTDSQGGIHCGEYWSIDEIDELTKGQTFPKGTTRWDKYVAYNYAYADFSKLFDEALIMSIAYSFYFADEEFNGGCKIWKYVSSKKY